MKLYAIIACLIMICVLSAPRSAFAQRFTSSGPMQSGRVTDSTSDTNGELAYEALKAGKLEDARDYLDDADLESPYAMFVRAALTEDAVTASNIYREIVAENEGKPIARQALIELYKYHYAAGQYAAAHRDYIELQKFPLPPPVSDPLGLKDSLQDMPAFQPQASGPASSGAAGTPATPPAADQAQPALYIVQVGVFTTADNARKFIQNLKVYGVNGKVFPKDIGGRTLYGVSAGTFSSRKAADDMAANLKSRSVNCIVVEK